MKTLSKRFARRVAERRVAGDRPDDRRQGRRGGRRREDRVRPWWQKGLLLGALGVAIRYWRLLGPKK